MKLLVRVKGGPGSGNFGHCGIPGEQGGSKPADQCQGGSDYSSTSDNFKNPSLRKTLDVYMAGHDIVPEDLLVDGKPIELSKKVPPGFKFSKGSNANWATEETAAVSKTRDTIRLHISPATIENKPDIVLHEIGHLVWADQMSGGSRVPLIMSREWYTAGKDLDAFAKSGNIGELQKLGLEQVYEKAELHKGGSPFRPGVPTGQFRGYVDEEEAFAEMFASWRLGDAKVKNNIAEFCHDRNMDAEVLFGSKRHDPSYKGKPRW